MKTSEQTKVFYSKHRDIEPTDSKKEKIRKKRRATFVVIPMDEKFNIHLAINHPEKDPFTKLNGLSEAMESSPVMTIPFHPGIDINKMSIKIGRSLIRSFQKNQSKWVQKKIDQNLK